MVVLARRRRGTLARAQRTRLSRVFQSQRKNDFERRCAACWPCAGSVRVNSGASFLQVPPEATEGFATLRLFKPSAAKVARALRNSLTDALAALEARQETDDAIRASVRSAAGAAADVAAAGKVQW